MISDNRRISTSSQTCYQDTVKILYPRTLHKTYAMVQEKKTEGFKNFYLNFAKFQQNDKTALETQVVSKKPNFPFIIPFLPDIKENYVDIFGKQNKIKKRFTSINLKNNDKREKVPRAIRHKKNLSAEIIDELFKEFPKTSKNKKSNKYSMHKTFYDILEEINEKNKKRTRTENEVVFE